MKIKVYILSFVIATIAMSGLLSFLYDILTFWQVSKYPGVWHTVCTPVNLMYQDACTVGLSLLGAIISGLIFFIAGAPLVKNNRWDILWVILLSLILALPFFVLMLG